MNNNEKTENSIENNTSVSNLEVFSFSFSAS